MHNTTTLNENLFSGKCNHWFQWYLSQDRVGHYAINSHLYLRMLREKHVKLYEKFSSQLQMYAKAKKNSFKGLFTYFSFATIKITGNYRWSWKGYSDYKSRLQYIHKKAIPILWYEISYLWNWWR